MRSDPNAKYPLPDPENIRKLLSLEQDLVTAAIIRLAWQAGLSPTEIANLRWSDIDADECTLSVAGRTVPVCQELISFLTTIGHKNSYVIYSRKARGGPATRISITHKARLALDSVGESETSLLGLRFGYIVRLLREQPIEIVSRIVDCEIRTLHEINDRYIDKIPNPKPKRINNSDAYEIDTQLMENKLEEEGNTLDAKIIMFAWMCGLSLEEMSNITWTQIDLESRLLRCNGKEIHIPQRLFAALSAEKYQSQDNEHVFKGERSANKLTTFFISRRAGEFFARHGFDQMTIGTIKGKYNQRTDTDIKNDILVFAGCNGFITTKKIASQFGLSINKTRRFLKDLVTNGDLKAAGSHYILSDFKSNREKFLDAVSSNLDLKSNVSWDSLAKATGFVSSLLQYYINQSIEEGSMIKCGYGLYHLVGGAVSSPQAGS